MNHIYDEQYKVFVSFHPYMSHIPFVSKGISQLVGNNPLVVKIRVERYRLTPLHTQTYINICTIKSKLGESG